MEKAAIPVDKYHKSMELIENNTQVAIKRITEFSRRLRYLNENLAKRTLKKKAEAN